MDTNIKIVEKIDPWTILSFFEGQSKRREQNDSSRLWAMETSIRSLKLVETNSELNIETEIVPNDDCRRRKT